ncbi:UPF0149 family protein [Roseateles sp. DXS20W]|uniref:UPF0149 family protein n=1 Tax=Pelomonas lactea TaxID=3299030 RepID=A0ABW7GNZ9_9BURK
MNYPQYNPASDNRPLADEELNDLDELLAALHADGTMNIEALDGYLAGLLLTPGRNLAALPGADWLPVVWGGDAENPDDNAPFASGKQRKKVVMLVLRHLQSIATAWAQHPQGWEPIFSFADGEDEDTEYADAEDWAAGFLTAVDLAPNAWAPWFDGAETGPLLAPIAALGSPDGALAEGSAQDRDEASRTIPDAMLALWAIRQKS